MLLMSLWFGRLATTESGAVSLLAGGFAIGLACFAVALLMGLFGADSILDEELGPRVSLLFVLLIIGGMMTFVTSAVI